MHIVIGVHPDYKEGHVWFEIPKTVQLPEHVRYPHEIRACVEDWYGDEANGSVGPCGEYTIVTTDRTVLGYVRPAGTGKGSFIIPYENVDIQITDGTLIPILQLESEAFMSHFDFGDLFARCSDRWVQNLSHLS